MTSYYISGHSSNSSDCLDFEDAERHEAIEEALGAYGPNGFHPVNVGDVFEERYEVVRKLGFGRESTVWLADDKKYLQLTCVSLIAREGRAVALKVIAAHAGGVELENLLKLKNISSEHPGRQHLPELLDYFEHNGVNGTHSCLVFEVLGENIDTFRRRLFSRSQVPTILDKLITRQLLSVLDFLHNICGFIHNGNT
jgi:serine/threonine-protein kinase SRPK3